MHAMSRRRERAFFVVLLSILAFGSWSGPLGVASSAQAAAAPVAGQAPASPIAAALADPNQTTVTLSTTAASFRPGTPFPVTAEFRQPVQGFRAESVKLGGAGGRVSEFTGDGAVYHFNVTPAENGTVVVYVPAGIASDTEERANRASNLLTVAAKALPDPSLLVHLPFDETEGRRAFDSSGHGNDGLLDFFPWHDGKLLTDPNIARFERCGTRGVAGGAIFLEGLPTFQQVTLPKIGIASNTVTFAAWIKRSASQERSTVLIASSPFPLTTQSLGLIFQENNALGYLWHGAPPQHPLSGLGRLVVPEGQWVHVALVVEPERATIYLTADGVTSSAANLAPHEPMKLDTLGVGAYFAPALKLAVDDVRIYSRALSAAEIHQLALLPSVPPPAPLTAPAITSKPRAPAAWPYRADLRSDFADVSAAERNTLTFSKVSGPEWLRVAPSGEISGTPTAGDAGTNNFVIAAENPRGERTEAPLRIEVVASGPVEVSGPTNPVWVEGAVEAEAVELAGLLNGREPVRIARETPTRWYADNASSAGKSLGVLVPEGQGEAQLTLIARFPGGGVRNVVYRVRPAATDLAGRDAARDSLTIRKGDALLLTASGAGASLEIEGAQGQGFQNAGAPGAVLPVAYPAAGSFTAAARVDGQPRGSLRVHVIEVDLSHSGGNLPSDSDAPLACQIAFGREKPIKLAPARLARSVWFTAGEPALLNATLKDDGPATSPIRVYLEALSTTQPLSLQARLAGPDGPMLDAHRLAVFDLRCTAETRMPEIRRFSDGSVLCSATLTLTPVVPDLDFHLGVFGEGGTFHDSTTILRFSSNDFTPDPHGGPGGIYWYGLVWRPGASLCHSGWALQDGFMVGHGQ